MGVGAQVFDESGNLMIDVTTRLSRLFGTLLIGAGSTGSVIVADSGTGAIWYALYTANGNRYSPVMTISGDTISWSPRGGFPGGAVDATMLYGRY